MIPTGSGQYLYYQNFNFIIISIRLVCVIKKLFFLQMFLFYLFGTRFFFFEELGSISSGLIYTSHLLLINCSLFSQKP